MVVVNGVVVYLVCSTRSESQLHAALALSHTHLVILWLLRRLGAGTNAAAECGTASAAQAFTPGASRVLTSGASIDGASAVAAEAFTAAATGAVTSAAA